MSTYEVHTSDKMYIVSASYFVANNAGVMFFDYNNVGIAFAPNASLNLVRLTKSDKNSSEVTDYFIAKAELK